MNAEEAGLAQSRPSSVEIYVPELENYVKDRFREIIIGEKMSFVKIKKNE